MMEFLKKYGKWIAVIAVVALTIYIVYYFFFKDSSGNSPKSGNGKGWKDLQGDKDWGPFAWNVREYVGNGQSDQAFFDNKAEAVLSWFKGYDIDPMQESKWFYENEKANAKLIRAYVDGAGSSKNRGNTTVGSLKGNS